MVNPAKTNSLDAILLEWALIPAQCQISALTQGLINDSFRIRDQVHDWVLQGINAQVFKNGDKVMHNIVQVCAHLQQKRIQGHYTYQVLEIQKTLKQADFYQDVHGKIWRCYQFIADTSSLQARPNPTQAYEAARAYAQFSLALTDLNPASLYETLPGFHDAQKRKLDWQASFHYNRCNRLSQCKEEARFINEQAALLDKWVAVQNDARLRRCIVHNDTKLNNLLFDEEGNVRCVVDLDTVMPGSLLTDFADLARSTINCADENEDLSKVDIDTELFEALYAGYRASLGAFEQEHQLLAVQAVTLVLAMRFLADFIDGDHYFRCEYEGHNLHRARNQLALYAALRARENDLKRIQCL